MAKQLNVNLGFSADTSQVKQQLQQLQDQLTKLAVTSGTGKKLGLTQELQEASTAAAQLKVQLEGAMNPKTGTLDLGKFNEAMNKSGMSLSKYQNQLRNLGPEGDKAFAQLAQSITQAEIPLKRASALTTELWTTLKNTARWQLSSSVLHGFMGTLQSAYGYAQDLNESLNNIRIVTGQSVEQMDAFALKANKAAQALSATTTEYTNAALIFYQQGLNNKEVEERTNATIKMAHAAGESAEEVSSYMTAIWNNFDNGSKSLEYYGDVMTELGAKTAASSAEIAQGLGKFAAIGETVGLEYEYATAAVATLVDKTREAPEAVGTALKTIFARLQGLQMGETLEDGLDLNKYSKALRAIGVEILDANGKMLDATSILDQVGAKWETLTQAQQTALAQTVAGTRQYTYFMSMFNNYDAMLENVDAAKMSEGTLQEQSEIYAEGWEASRDRVRAAAEAIYGALLNDDFFIDINDGFAGFLGIVEDTIEGLGGLKGVLLTIGTIVTQVFKKQIADSLGNMAYNLKMSTAGGRQSLIDIKKEANEKLVKENFDQDTVASRSAGTAYQAQGEAQNNYIANAERMSEEERKISQILLDRNRIMSESVIKAGEELEAAQDLTDELIRQNDLYKTNKSTGKKDFAKDLDALELRQRGRQKGNIDVADNKIYSAAKNVFGSNGNVNMDTSALGALKDTLTGIAQGYKQCDINMEDAFGEDAFNAFNQLAMALESPEASIEELTEAWSKWTDAVSNGGASEQTLEADIKALGLQYDLTEDQITKLTNALVNAGTAEGNLAGQTGKLAQMGEGLKKFFNGAKGEAMSMSTALTQTASTIMSCGMAISSITGLIDTWKDSEASLGEKILATMTTLGMVIPTLISVAKGFQGAGNAVTIFGVKTSLAMWQVTLIVAAIAAVIALFAVFIKMANDASPEAQLKRTQQAASDLKESLQEAKDKAQDLKDTFDEYNSLVDTLDDCIKGTQEWRDALEAVNECALDLLDKYPELAKYEDLFVRNIDGMLELNAEVMDQVLQDAKNAVDVMTASSLLASAHASQQQADIKTNDTVSDIRYEGSITDYETGYTYFNEASVALADAIQEDVQAFANLEPEEFAEKVDLMAQEMGISTDEYQRIRDRLLGYQDEVDNLARATRDAANQMDNATLALANQVLQDSGHDAAETMMATHGLQDQYDSIYDEIIGISDKNYQSDTNTQYSDEIWERFEAATGKHYTQVDNTIQGNDDNRVYAYKDETGKEQTFSIEYMAEVIAASEAMAQLGTNADEAANALSQMAENNEAIMKEQGFSDADAEAIASGLRNFVSTESFESMSGSEMSNLKSVIGDTSNTADVEAYINSIYDSSAIKAMGYESSAEMAEAFMQGIEDYDDTVTNISKDLLSPVKDAFDYLGTDNDVSLAGQKAIAGILQNSFVNGGEEGLEEMTHIFSSMRGDDAEKLANAMNSIDWNNADVNTLNRTFKEMGVAANFTDDALRDMIEAMADPRYIQSFDDVSEAYSSLISVAEGLEFGDTISAEDFDVLGDEFSTFFTRMADGTYKLTGDAEDFYNAVQGKAISGFEENIQKYKDQNADLQRISGYNLEDMQTSQLSKDGTSYSGTDVRKQLDVLDVLGYDPEQIAKWQEDLSDKHASPETLNAIAAAVGEYRVELESLNQTIAFNEQQIYMQEVALASSYTKLSDLKDAYEKGTISAEAYTQAAINLHEAEQMEDIDVEEMEDYADHLMDIAENSEMLDDSLKNNEDAAEDVAKATMRLNKGIDKLADGFEDWNDVITNSDEASQEYAEAMSGMKDAMSDVLGVSEDFVSNDFIVDHLEDIEKAATGDEEAIARLQRALSDDIICQVMGVSDFDQLNSDLQTLQNDIWNMFSDADIKVGATLETDDFLTAANKLITDAGMTVDQAQAYFNSLGYEPEFVTEEQTVKRSIPQETTHTDYAVTQGSINIMGTEVPIPTIDRITTTRVTGYEELDEVIQVPALSADGTPKIKKLTRTGSTGGGMSNYSSSNKGGKSPGSSSKGGSGGSKDKKKEKKDYKKLADEIERYHEINNLIEDSGRALDRLSKAKDRAYGKSKLSLMDQEIAALETQIGLQEQYREEIEANLALDADALTNKKTGYGAIIENGNITNYDEMMKQQLSKYNAEVDIYNASAQEDADKERLQDAEDAYQAFLDAVKQYEETHDLWMDSELDLIDKQNELYDKRLEKTQYIVELKIEVSDDVMEYLDYLLERIGDSAYDAAEALSVLDNQAQQSFNRIAAYGEGLLGIFQNHGFTKEDMDKFLAGDPETVAKFENEQFTEDEIAAIREYKSGIIEENQALLELQDTVRGKVMEAFEELTGEMDDQIDKIDKLGQMTQNYRDIIDIVGQDYLGITDELMNSLNAAKVQTAMDGITATQAKLDAMKESREEAQRKLAEAEAAGLTDTADFWRETIEEMDKQIDDATLEVQEKLKAALEAIAQEFDESVQRAADSFKDAMAGAAGNMELLQARMDRASQVRERYIPEYEKVYELSKLTRDINNSIDDTDNIRAKKELMKLMEEINEIQESGAELSEYSLQRLQKEYELKQAELALEEAKEAKTQVRMTVDNEGNWGYVYTADDTAVKEAEQNYEDKLYEMESLTQEYLQNLQDMMVQNEIEFAEAVAQIEADRGTKEWYEELERLTAHHKGQQDYYMSEMGIALEDAHEDYNTNAEVYGEATAAKIAADESFVMAFGDTQLAVETGFQTMEGYQQAFNEAIGTPDEEGTLLGDVTAAYNLWDERVDGAMERAGTSVETFATDMDTQINGEGGIIDQSEAAAEKAEELGETFVTTMGEIMGAVQQWELDYSQRIDTALGKTDNLINKMNELLRVWAGVNEMGGLDADVPDPTDPSPTTPSGDDDTKPGNGDTGKDNSDKIEGVAASIWMQGSGASGWGTGATRRARFAEKGVSAAQDYINAHAENGDIYRAWHNKRGQLKQYYYGAFDTGGYTGEWGPEGKFAMLHQKEIVLNPEDTENLLSAVNLIREISSIIDLNAMSASHGLSSMLGIGKVGNSRETLEQSVTIHAEFPGVSDRNEIEEAFNNLINAASQYANRKS